MSKLHIFFCNYAPDSGEAVVPLEVINERLEHVEYAPRILTLSQSVEVDVEPGTYLVRTYLPSGELVSKQTTVDAGKTSDVALTAAQRSPDEEVGWSSPFEACATKATPAWVLSFHSDSKAVIVSMAHQWP